MSGLLDKKSRMLDFIITDIGREELANGELDIKYFSFTDLYSIYDSDPEFDHTMLLAFEATSLQSDLVLTDIENNGLVLSTRMSGTSNKNITQIFSEGTLRTSSFSAYVDNSIKPIQNQFLIGNKQRYIDADEFIISPTTMSFNIYDDTPISLNDKQIKSLNSMPNIFQDDDFKTQQNFKFLKPINPDGRPVFDFDDITARNFPRTTSDILQATASFIKSQKLTFSETSENNSCIFQFFEIIGGDGGEKELRKLKIVKHESEKRNDNNAYFVGKTIADSRGIESFIKLFTVVLVK